MQVFTLRILRLSSPQTAKNGNFSEYPGSGKIWVLLTFVSLGSSISLTFYQLMTRNMCAGKHATMSLLYSYSSRYIGSSFSKLIDSVFLLYISRFS